MSQRPDLGSGGPGEERILVEYRLTCDGENPEAKACDIALEQTVELPSEAVSPEIEGLVVGRVENLEHEERQVWNATISYPVTAIGTGASQLFSVLFGNISLKTGVLVTNIELPDSLLRFLPGPRFGIEGLRRLSSVTEPRPLLCTALKPMGLSAEGLAELCYQFALGGCDIIKDDHGLVHQRTARFEERVFRCVEAVRRANEETGGNSLYFPNVVSSGPPLEEDLELVRAAGCQGILVSPLVLGLDTVRWIASNGGLAILSHPSLAGAFFHPDHGVSPAVLLGKLFRIVGSDGVIYPNVGGRFALSEADCRAINESLRSRMGSMQPALPVPAGGIDTDLVPRWIERYGADTMFLIGGSLYAKPDLVDATKNLMSALRSHS
jgi:ribulose-bisphosphate carboxylase large chain